MAVNKVEYGDTTLIDLTSDTVTKKTLLIGVTAHTASGESISGEFDPEIYLRKSGGDTTNNIVTFTSGDSTSPTAWTNVDSLVTGEKHSSLLNKISTMIKNVRFLYKMLGTTDISTIGDGTVTGGLSTLNSSLSKLEEGQDYSKEIIIGKWFDGKPIYRKIIKIPMTNFVYSSTLQDISIPHNIENIDRIVSNFSAGAMDKPNGHIYGLPYIANGSVDTYCYSVDKTSIVFSNKANWGSNYDIVFILDYTKVTE